MAGVDYVPRTEGEWRTAILAEIRQLRAELREFRDDHGDRIRSLEETRNEQRGGLILVKIGLASLAPIGVVAGWLGSRFAS